MTFRNLICSLPTVAAAKVRELASSVSVVGYIDSKIQSYLLIQLGAMIGETTHVDRQGKMPLASAHAQRENSSVGDSVEEPVFCLVFFFFFLFSSSFFLF